MNASNDDELRKFRIDGLTHPERIPYHCKLDLFFTTDPLPGLERLSKADRATVLQLRSMAQRPLSDFSATHRFDLLGQIEAHGLSDEGIRHIAEAVVRSDQEFDELRAAPYEPLLNELTDAQRLVVRGYLDANIAPKIGFGTIDLVALARERPEVLRSMWENKRNAEPPCGPTHGSRQRSRPKGSGKAVSNLDSVPSGRKLEDIPSDEEITARMQLADSVDFETLVAMLEGIDLRPDILHHQNALETGYIGLGQWRGTGSRIRTGAEKLRIGCLAQPYAQEHELTWVVVIRRSTDAAGKETVCVGYGGHNVGASKEVTEAELEEFAADRGLLETCQPHLVAVEVFGTAKAIRKFTASEERVTAVEEVRPGPHPTVFEQRS